MGRRVNGGVKILGGGKWWGKRHGEECKWWGKRLGGSVNHTKWWDKRLDEECKWWCKRLGEKCKWWGWG